MESIAGLCLLAMPLIIDPLGSDHSQDMYLSVVYGIEDCIFLGFHERNNIQSHLSNNNIDLTISHSYEFSEVRSLAKLVVEGSDLPPEINSNIKLDMICVVML